MCSHVDSFHNFLHLYIVILAVSGYTKVYIDLGAEHGTYALRIDTFVIFICTDRHLTGGYQRKQFLCCHAFLLSYDVEMQKVMEAVNMGAHAIMDLSSHVNTIPFRRKLTSECSAMIGTVPVYDSVIQIRLWVKTFTVYSQLASAGPPVFICWGRLFVHVVYKF